MRHAALCLILACAFASAQQRMENVRIARPGAQSRVGEQAKLKVTPEQKQRAEQIILSSVGEARGIEDAGGRAYALLQVARAMQPSDKKTATELLEEALTATRSLDEDKAQTKQRLQRQILKAYVSLAPERADKMVDELDVDGRKDVLTSLLGYYEQKKQTKRALEVINRIGQESEIPYGSASRVLASLKPEQSNDAQELFASALTSFRTHGDENSNIVGPGSFADLIQVNWEKLPSGLVKAGIDEVLSAAQKSDKGMEGRPMQMAMMSEKGGVQFNSNYDLALFQLAPILKQIAPSEAESRLKQSQATRESLERFPKGLSSFGPSNDAPPEGGDSGPKMMMTMTMDDGGPPSGPPPGMPSPAERMQVGKIIANSREHPQDALTQAAGLTNSTAKTDAYLGIARSNAKKNASIAKQALDKAMELQVADSQMEVVRLDEAADLYLQLDEPDAAKKVVEKKMDAAERAYRKDTNADAPNTALKAYWPSTAEWRSALRTATRISPVWAQSLLKEIGDPEIRTLSQIALASMMLDVPAEPLTIITQTKDGVSVLSGDVAGERPR